MKNLIQITCAVLIVSLSSCSTSEDPVPTAKTIVNEINEVLDFSDNETFFHPIDINQDGTIDFLMRGHRGIIPENPDMGNVTMVTLTPVNERNEAITRVPETFNACNLTIQYTPVRMLKTSESSSSSYEFWSSDPTIYAHMSTSGDCNYYVKHFETNANNVIGVRFVDNNQILYGWIKVMAEDLSPAGCPGVAEKWTLIEFGYNPIAGEAAAI